MSLHAGSLVGASGGVQRPAGWADVVDAVAVLRGCCCCWVPASSLPSAATDLNHSYRTNPTVPLDCRLTLLRWLP